jgi:hypothetical protein
LPMCFAGSALPRHDSSPSEVTNARALLVIPAQS